jgi:hypothetical protein
MNNPTPAGFIPEMMRDLHAFAELGNEALALASREHQALSGAANYEPFDFYQVRKSLLVRLEPIIIKIKYWRQNWQLISIGERAGYPDVIAVIQMLQDLLVKALQLDRENQQALLRRGLVPARHVSAVAAPPSHFVANLYRRHASH